MRGEISAWNFKPGPSLSLLDFREPPLGPWPLALRRGRKRVAFPASGALTKRQGLVPLNGRIAL